MRKNKVENKPKVAAGIKTWPKEDRPREKLFKRGEHCLSDAELLAIILRTGIKGESALDLARKILQKFGTFRFMSHVDFLVWKGLKGLGNAKIAQIKAAIEIGRRFGEEKVKDKKTIIAGSRDAAGILMPRLRDLKKEVFKLLLLNAKNVLLDIVEITEGTVNQASPIIREIFQKALQGFAVSIICAHNHPSGEIKPSNEDVCFTRELLKTGNGLGIRVLDHIIIGDDQYFSFNEEGLLSEIK